MNQYSKTDELFVTVTHAADHSAPWLAQWKRPGMGSAPHSGHRGSGRGIEGLVMMGG